MGMPELWWPNNDTNKKNCDFNELLKTWQCSDTVVLNYHTKHVSLTYLQVYWGGENCYDELFLEYGFGKNNHNIGNYVCRLLSTKYCLEKKKRLYSIFFCKKTIYEQNALWWTASFKNKTIKGEMDNKKSNIEITPL